MKKNSNDQALLCLIIIFKILGISYRTQLAEYRRTNCKHEFTTNDVLKMASECKVRAKSLTVNSARLSKIPLPAILEEENGDFFVLARLSLGEDGSQPDRALIHDPASQQPTILPIDALLTKLIGARAIVLTRGKEAHYQRFGIDWFLPILYKYRKLIRDVFLASFVMQLLVLVTPMLFQVITDKVLTHRVLETLDVIGIALLGATVFEVALNAIRTYLFSHTTNRVDVELSSRLFRHLIHLPLPYFMARPTGDSIVRVRELENIRSFLTTTGLTLSLDLVFSFVFFCLMYYYSSYLTGIVALSIPVYALLSLIFTPLLQKRLKTKFERAAENQAFLVETIGGIHTAKSLAIESILAKRWDEQTARCLNAGFKALAIGNFASSGVTLISKLTTVAILYFGAKQVITGDISVGQLVAFNMLANHVAAPIMRVAQLWTEFQQVSISISRLGDIMNTPTENVGGGQTIEFLSGAIKFENVSFRYTINTPLVVTNFNLEIAPGEIVGIVGRSGSGKSTLSGLLQKLLVPTAGAITVDGHNLALVSALAVRRHVGVVMQESVLFSGTIRDNICAAAPGCPFEKIVEAAKLAGAHDFITKLPMGYETYVGENGATLSGGQRQRIAIARTLLPNPRVLIFDEATSALDYESESIIQKNLKNISQGRTVLIIAHRLATVKKSDRIIVIDEGRLAEEGSHQELLSIENGHYSSLYRYQHI
jgi:subfamily B ATP-binding cassette protein HlyB/CyaB